MYTSTYASSYGRKNDELRGNFRDSRASFSRLSDYRSTSDQPSTIIAATGVGGALSHKKLDSASSINDKNRFSSYSGALYNDEVSSSLTDAAPSATLSNTGTGLFTASANVYPLRSWKSEVNLNKDSAARNYTSTYNTLVNGSKMFHGDRMTVYTGLPLAGSGRLDMNLLFTQVARINDHLYLCSINALSPQKLENLGISLVVSAMIDSPPSNIRGPSISNMHICVEDIETANLKIHFDRVADRIASERQRGGKVVVHCMAGVSRSTSLVLAYLMKYQNMNLAQAYTHVRAIRPCVHPNGGFWRQLVDYERKLKGFNSVELVSSTIGARNYTTTSLTPGLFGGGRYRASPLNQSRYISPQFDHSSRSLSRPKSFFSMGENSGYRSESLDWNSATRPLDPAFSLFARY
ncbi:Dual specificity protein phosphatase 14 [Cichlidogyrus casuarinus]|uniref:Dual specificity protein phosphatase 14 n=1 Tax=Cichlidogyrus casuarinus TaxID=1844966 RepID=A0ABD2Q4I4_9PLAT